MSPLVPALYVLTALAGTAVVLTRKPGAQVFVLAFYGIVLSMLLLALAAPDVALSQLAVGGVIVPLMVVVTLARLRGGPKP